MIRTRRALGSAMRKDARNLVRPALKRVFPWPRRRLERHELAWLGGGLVFCVLLYAFIALAGEVMDGDTRALDTAVLRALRNADDPATPIGPAWLETALVDVTALGGPTVIWLVVAAVVGFLCLQARYRTAMMVAVAAGSGEILNQLLKLVFMRPRPSVVPHLRDVTSASFPSGHAMESAIVYLTLGVMLMRVAERGITKLYCLAIAMLVTFLVGSSRVYLGVHYPTDVLGGWILGFLWASVCWFMERRLDTTSGVAAERHKSE
jgi:undecaprenyl-diphosphatase